MNMPVTAPAFAAKLAPIPDSFTAWRQRDGGKAQPLDTEGAATLAEALQCACASARFKDVLFIRETAGLTGKATLHCYVIRQGKAEWRRCPETGAPKQVRPSYADNLFALPVHAFDPVETWKWTPGCDVVGVDRNVVEMGR